MEIKVDPPADGNAANQENTASGTIAVQLERLILIWSNMEHYDLKHYSGYELIYDPK